MRIIFILFFIFSLLPNTFAQKDVKKFNQELMNDLEKTKDNDYIYREGRVPASEKLEFNWKAPTNNDIQQDDYQQVIEYRKYYKNPTGLSKW
ncbi:MAG: hypothetical protein JNM93_13440 [Bacteriovoracaceae bacterium]|nr:hypothetical protein [Bacteriovoracaceae bacterium]